MSRHPNEESRERNIARCHTDEGRAILKSRKHIVEPAFGHMKAYGGLGLINCRGKAKANVKVVMAAVAYNLAKLVRAKARQPYLFVPCRAFLHAIRRALRALCSFLFAAERESPVLFLYWPLYDRNGREAALLR